MMFVDMPGSERLAMDPEVLLLREGVLLNKSLLDFARGELLIAAMTSAALPCTMDYLLFTCCSCRVEGGDPAQQVIISYCWTMQEVHARE
jgi:hypothetical protein